MKHFYFKFSKKTFIHLFLGIGLLLGTQAMQAATYKTIASGSWTNPATWDANGIPITTNSSHTIIISAGHTVNITLTAAFSAGALNIQSGATLNVSQDTTARGFTIGTLAPGSTIAGALLFDVTVTGSKSFGTVTVTSSGSVIETTRTSISLNNGATGNFTNYGTITTGTLGTSGAFPMYNYGTMNISTGFNSGSSTGNFYNYAGATLNYSGGAGCNVRNYGTLNVNTYTGGNAASIYNYSGGVINFNTNPTASLWSLYTNYTGNTVNYALAGSQTVKTPADGSYNNLILSNSGTKTIGTAASNTLCTGTLTISGSGGGSGVRANVTNANIGVEQLVLGTTGQDAGTIGFTGSGATTINTTYFTTGTGSLNVLTSSSPTTWNGSAWSNGTPTVNRPAVLAGDYASGTFTAKSLTVDATKVLTIASGTNVTVAEALTNNGTINVANNANFVQTATTNTNSGSGTMSVTRNSNPLSRLDYTLWSSPTGTTQKLNEFSPATSTGRFYEYNSGTNIYNVVADATPFSIGKGFLIRMPNTAVAAPAVETFTGLFTGIPNNGTINLTTAAGYNAIGNPYPSTLDANAFINANIVGTGTTNLAIDGTLWFWREKNGTAGTAYATYTTAGGVANDNGGIAPTQNIQVGQGFFVNRTGVATVTFSNAMRTSSNSAPFLRTKAVTQPSRVWINLMSGSDMINQMMIAYMDSATTGFDAGIDGKYINDSATALTSDIAGEEYVIQGRPAFDATDVVALNFKTENGGTFTIAKFNTDGVFATGQDVYLLDKTTGTETNLQTDAYTFTAAAGVDNARFSLKYQKTLKVNPAAFNENTVMVYGKNGSILVNSGANTISNIKVYDIQGRLLAEQKEVNATTATIKNLRASQQMLLVKVTGADASVVTKKVIN